MPAYQNKSTNVSGSGTAALIGLPAGFAAGEFLLIPLLIDENGAAVTGLSADQGFGSPIVDEYVNIGGVQYHALVFGKRATGFESSVSITWTNSVFYDGYCARYTSVYGTGAPYEFAIGSQTSSATHTAPSVNSTYSNSLWVYIGFEDNYAAWSQPSGFTENVDGGASNAGYLASKALSATGATGTADSTTGAGAGVVISLLLFDTTPAGGGGGSSNAPRMSHRRQMMNQ